MNRQSRALRRYVGNCFSLAVFYSWMLGVVWLVIPWARHFGSTDATPELRARAAVSRHARHYLRFVRRLGLLEVTVDGAQRLAGRSSLVVANHPSLIDFVVLVSLMPYADCIVNPARAQSRLLGGLVSAADYVRSDAGTGIIPECVARLRAGHALVFFPEGTRSPRSGLGTFQRGAARVALEASCDLTPVLITVDPPTLAKNQKWYDLPTRLIHATVRVLEPVSSRAALEAMGEQGWSRSRAARHLTAELRETFAKGLHSVDVGRT